MVSVHKTHKLYSDISLSCLSPYLEELSVYLGQKEAYASASETMETLLHVRVNGMQIQRQVMDYGEKVESLLSEETPPLELGSEEPVYGMMDGAMIFTREEGWKEVKLGRVFKERALFSLNEKRNWVRNSEYISHLGGHKAFEQKFGVVLDKYEHLDKRLVFISDGAKWIWN